MKVAVCLSGQPRNYKKSFQTIQDSFLSELDVDFYFHTWNDVKFTSTDFGFGKYEYLFPQEFLEELIEIFEPINYQIEHPIVFDASGYRCPIWRQPLNNTLSMFYSIYKSFLLLKNDIKYDYVIRSRFDLDYSIYNPIFNNKLQIPSWHNSDHRVIHRGVDDIFAMGNYTDMKKYSSAFSYLISYITNDDEFLNYLYGGWPTQDSPLRNEYLLKWHLYKQKVTYETFTTVNNGILR